MKDKLKKHNRSIIIKITSIFVAVWLIVSVVFSITVISMDKTEILNQEQEKFRILVSGIENNGSSTLDLYVDNLKQPYMYTESEKPEINCGADGYIDSDMQVVVLSKNDDGTYSEIIDTDKSIYMYGFTYINEDATKSMAGGNIYYDSFVQSITQKQLNSISDYLNTRKDSNGNYYELICTKFYIDEKSDSIIPKTVEIVLTNKDNTWYAQDEVIETYELNPEVAEKSTLYTSSDDDRNVIPGQFVLGTFRSGGLIDVKADDEAYTFLDMGLEKVAPFTYIYKNGANAFTTIKTSDDVQFKDYGSDGIYYEVYQTLEANIVINYAKRFNILDSCKDTLILGIAVLFLFFLVVGVILSIMMCKVMKTQVIAEQKRVEITNALAHDIKTPLFIISGYAQNLKENVNTQKRGHYADKIIERTDEVNEIVHKMLDFTKLGELNTKPEHDEIDLKALITDIIAEFDTLSNGKHIDINCDDNVMINGDTELLTRALRNLVDNAVRYSDNGSVIKVELTDNTLSVSNDCSSITQDDIPHLTEPYYKAEKNRNTKGNGLGLSIVKSIIDMHNYKLDIKLDNQTITFSILF